MIDFDTLDNIQKELANINLTDENQKIYNKVEALLNLANNRLHSEYAIFLSDSEDQNLNVYLTNILQIIKNDISHPQSGYYHNLSSPIQNILNILKNIPDVQADNTRSNLTQIISTFKTQTTIQKNKYEQRLKELERTITQLENKVKQKENDVLSLTTTFQDQFSKAQEERLNEFANTLKNEENKFIEKFNELEKESKNYINKLQERDNKSLGLLGRIAGQVFGKFYTGASNRAKWLGHGLFATAVVYMVILSWHIFWIIIESKTDLDWKLLFYKTVVLLPLYIPAIYLIFEANRQREKEEKYQELGMRIAASSPYLEKIEEDFIQKEKKTDELDKLKIDLAKKFFSENLYIENKKQKKFSKKEILNIIKEVFDICRKENIQ